jgi:hypothetical protein
MEKDGCLTNISLTGEVVQTINKDKRRYVKLANVICCVEIASASETDIHLGDILVINGRIEIQSIDPCFNKKRRDTLLHELCNEDMDKE